MTPSRRERHPRTPPSPAPTTKSVQDFHPQPHTPNRLRGEPNDRRTDQRPPTRTKPTPARAPQPSQRTGSALHDLDLPPQDSNLAPSSAASRNCRTSIPRSPSSGQIRHPLHGSTDERPSKPKQIPDRTAPPRRLSIHGPTTSALTRIPQEHTSPPAGPAPRAHHADWGGAVPDPATDARIQVSRPRSGHRRTDPGAPAQIRPPRGPQQPPTPAPPPPEKTQIQPACTRHAPAAEPPQTSSERPRRHPPRGLHGIFPVSLLRQRRGKRSG